MYSNQNKKSRGPHFLKEAGMTTQKEKGRETDTQSVSEKKILINSKPFKEGELNYCIKKLLIVLNNISKKGVLFVKGRVCITCMNG